jgi:hypothetical protein
MYARANTPNSLQGALGTAARAPFFKERRMKFVEPTGPNRKFGAMGHAVQSLWEWWGRFGRGSGNFLKCFSRTVTRPGYDSGR